VSTVILSEICLSESIKGESASFGFDRRPPVMTRDSVYISHLPW